MIKKEFPLFSEGIKYNSAGPNPVFYTFFGKSDSSGRRQRNEVE